MTEWVEQWICIKFCIKLEHSSVETIQMIQKAAAVGNWWLAASSQQHVCSCITSHESFLAKHQITQMTQPLYSPAVVLCTSGFSQNSNHLWKGDFRPLMRFRKPSQNSWWWLGELCEVPRCLPWRGLRRCCPVYNVSCILYILHIINVYFSYYMAGYLLDRPHIVPYPPCSSIGREGYINILCWHY